MKNGDKNKSVAFFCSVYMLFFQNDVFDTFSVIDNAINERERCLCLERNTTLFL